ncbi:quinone oxidoreductase family protein [Actinokineospora sp.]|uniref:quinone oxidoreductase family protein n=1 Tax=Actinokineospora sp. TaxID=1872133 RepID=UPI0040383E80
MRAVVLREFGPASVLRLGTFPDPVAERGWVVVRLRASALNWHDVLVRQGKYRSPVPHVLGADGAGERVDTGEPVMILPSLWWGADNSAPGPGFEILGDHAPGTYAELVRVPEECVVPKPDGLDWAQAAALPLVGVTCFRALFTRGRLTAGESVLVLGASGGVATMAVSLAAAAGARVVVTSSSAEKIERARALGASDGVGHTGPDWVSTARESAPGGHGFDLVLDSVGRWPESVRALRPGGRLVVLGASLAERADLDIRSFYFGQYDLLGTTMGSPRDFAGLLSMMDTTRVAPPVIDTVFPLDAADRAHERLEQGTGFGKIVLSHD